MTKELPKEMWALVLGKIEGVLDFARVQPVSKTFCALVRQNCWTKVNKIDIDGLQTIRTEDCFSLKIDTGLSGQELQLPVGQAALLLEKIVEKTPKTTAVRLNFAWMLERDQQVFCRFLDALVTAKIQLKKIELCNLTFDTQTISLVLARFLRANVTSLISLKLTCLSTLPLPVQELLEAFRDSTSLENIEITCHEPLGQKILAGKSQLISLKLLDDCRLSPATLLDSGARLLYFSCRKPDVLMTYKSEVQHRDRTMTKEQPLRSLQTLGIDSSHESPTLPWGLFPNLQLLTLRHSFVQQMVDIVRSYLGYWGRARAEKVLEFRIEDMWKKRSGGVHVTREGMGKLSRRMGAETEEGDGATLLVFRRGDVAVRVLIQIC